jgi:dTMP kinase
MFITLEGPDGSGKSTQISHLAQALRARGFQVTVTREPGGTDIGDQVREVIMKMKNTAMHPRTEILLFQASRAQIVEEVIRPRLQRGEIVLCDRYADSTMAYQGYGHGTDLDLLRLIIDFATGGLSPDLTVLFDIDVEAGLKRRQTGGGEWNRLDDYQLAFHQRVREGYLKMASAEPGRWLSLDAGQDQDTVKSNLLRAVLPRVDDFFKKAGQSLPLRDAPSDLKGRSN